MIRFWLLIGPLFFLVSTSVYAVSDNHTYQYEAQEHATSECAAMLAATHSHTCTTEDHPDTGSGLAWVDQHCTLEGNFTSCDGITIHYYTTENPVCDANGPPISGFYSSGATAICDTACQYTPGSGVSTCFGAQCFGSLSPTGDACSFTEPVSAPQGCSVSVSGTVVCDCSANPSAPFCPGGSDPAPANNCIQGAAGYVCYENPNDMPPQEGDTPGSDPGDPPGDDSSSGGNSGGGDGDPDTPGSGDGTGDGDTDGDDQRDVDCNPLSNPDCPFAGSATAIGDCDAQPSCSGDPVQCAMLQQQWRNMCYPFNDQGKPLKDWRPLVGGEFDQFNDSIDISAGGGLDDSGFLGGGSCPAADSVNLVGISFVIEYQPFCDAASWISYLVMFMASMVSLRILFT